jgi:hypothetical protein
MIIFYLNPIFLCLNLKKKRLYVHLILNVYHFRYCLFYSTFVLIFDLWPLLLQGVPLTTEPGISLIILTPSKILQRNLNSSTFVVWEMERNVSVVCVCFVAISSLVLELLKKCRVRWRVGHTIYLIVLIRCLSRSLQNLLLTAWSFRMAIAIREWYEICFYLPSVC